MSIRLKTSYSTELLCNTVPRNSMLKILPLLVLCSCGSMLRKWGLVGPKPMYTRCSIDYKEDKEFCSCYTYFENGDVETFDLEKRYCENNY